MNRTNLKGRGVLFRRGFALLCAAAMCAFLAGCGAPKQDGSPQDMTAPAASGANDGMDSGVPATPGANDGTDSGVPAVPGANDGTDSGVPASSGENDGTDSGVSAALGANDGTDSGVSAALGVNGGTDSGAAPGRFTESGASSQASSVASGAEEPAEAAKKAESSVGVGGAILPGIGSILNISPPDKNELSQYIGMSFRSLEREFPGIESATSIGMRSYYLGGAVGSRTHQVGLSGSENGGVITQVNLYAGDEYMIAGIKAGITLGEARKRAAAAGFDQVGKSRNGLTVYDCPDGLQVTVYSSDGSTVDTVTCENG